VSKDQNQDQCSYSIQALSKAAFSWLVDIANETLDVKELKRVHLIDVLDIAGFENLAVLQQLHVCAGADRVHEGRHPVGDTTIRR